MDAFVRLVAMVIPPFLSHPNRREHSMVCIPQNDLGSEVNGMCLCDLLSDQCALVLIVVALILIWYFNSCQNCGGHSGYVC